MKPTNVLDMTRQGDLGGQKIAMEFDASSIAHIMSVLTDLYSDQELAVIREYSTNARDSHIAAGQTRPIEVTTPNNLSPYFKVKDYGVGLSVDDIEKIYSKYGASTKRGTDSQTGMLGLGCKSALTYTNQFMLTSVKNGVKVLVSVGRMADGTGTMEIVDTKATTEPNGVEISVPAKQGNTFSRKSLDFFRFWQKGTVLLNGAEPAAIVGEQITPNMISVKSDVLETDIIVMGGVAYKCGNNLYSGHRSYYNSFRVVAFVDIGEVNFVPSREDMAMTPLTKATIARLNKEFSTALWTTVQDDIEAQKSHPEALAAVMKWEKLLGTNPNGKALTYQGAIVPKQWQGTFSIWRPNRSRYSLSTGYRQIDHNTIESSVIVTDYDPTQKITGTHKEKMRKWAADNNLSPQQFVLCLGANPGLPWVNGKGVVSWADIKSYKLNNGPRQARVVKYDVFDATLGYFKETDTLVGTEFLYVSPKERMNGASAKVIQTAFPNHKIVQIGENRWEKFKRENPTAQHVDAAVMGEIKKVEASLTDLDKRMIAMENGYSKGTLKNFDESLVLDGDLAAEIKVAKGLTTSANVVEYNKVKNLARHAGMSMSNISGSVSTLERYPLVSNLYGKDQMAHAVLYINAVYTARLNGATL